MLNESVIVFISKVGELNDQLPLYVVNEIEKINNQLLKEQKYSAYRLLNRALTILGYNGLFEKTLKKRQDGKPYFDDMCVSISHTKGLVGVCFFNSDVGIDVEKISRFEKFKFPMLMGLDYHLPKQTYAKEWTKKEASFKVSGGEVFSPIKINADNFYTKTIKVINGDDDYFLTISSQKKYDVNYVVCENQNSTKYNNVEEIIF